ncbi:caspase family protein [Streptacidiphilus sp. P02-A3a]|uniref:VMAP-C domain-containing protein n=1 Tax=Streptacidiphilus sp. P02-A3a TaxID=2704468 RepID=UPI0015F80E94|nr:caspase family protein [Streptacidiphilus sp. P02-A3a]QMU72443.1 hypothetical protein GXP74_33560 [Streptacidiphilus sp. P02-A3a]
MAVEDYGSYSKDWNVTGPYAGARSFRDWLIGRGVPAGNITFLGRPLPESRGIAPNEPEAGSPADGGLLNGTSLQVFFGEVLPDIDAELLWVFWAGHGITDGEQRHQLLLPADGRKGLETVDARELRDTLISTEWGMKSGTHLSRVAMVIDACQNNLPPTDKGLKTWPVSVRSKDMRSTARPFFTSFSCGPDQKAYTGTNRTHLAATLMEYLDANPSLLPHPQHMMGHIDLAFAKRSEAQAQTPSWEILNWGEPVGTGVFELTPTEEECALALQFRPGLDDREKRRRCVEELENRGVAVTADHQGEPPSPEQLVAAAGRVRHGLPTLVDLLCSPQWRDDEHERLDLAGDLGKAVSLIHEDEFLTVAEYDTLLPLLDRAGDTLEQVARFGRSWSEHLRGMPVTAQAVTRKLEAAGALRGRLPLLLGFTALLAALTGSVPPDEGQDAVPDGPLQTWWLGVAARLGYGDRLLRDERAKAAEDASRLQQTPGGWLLVEVQTTCPEAVPGHPNRYDSRAWYFDVEGTHQQVFNGSGWTDWQHSLEAAVADHVDENLSGIEFLLPQSQLELQVERLAVEYRGRSNVLLGHVHPVVVRCGDRETSPARQAQWQDNWKHCSQDHDGAPWLVKDGAALKELTKGLTGHQGCVELTGTAKDFSAALAVCLREGSPIISWNRCTGDIRPLQSLEPIHGRAPSSLPAALHDWRRAGPSSGSDDVVLLWDNPDRRTQRPRLRSPRRRNR